MAIYRLFLITLSGCSASTSQHRAPATKVSYKSIEVIMVIHVLNVSANKIIRVNAINIISTRLDSPRPTLRPKQGETLEN